LAVLSISSLALPTASAGPSLVARLMRSEFRARGRGRSETFMWFLVIALVYDKLTFVVQGHRVAGTIVERGVEDQV
jgi:hypothetical protein